jgi:hypothetical protein
MDAQNILNAIMQVGKNLKNNYNYTNITLYLLSYVKRNIIWKCKMDRHYYSN